jgi:hypothetical protein
MVKILVVNAQDEFSLTSNITAKDFGKALDETVETSEVTVYSMNKPLFDDFESVAAVPTKLFSKAVSSTTDPLADSTTLALNKPLFETVVAADLNTLLLTKPLAHSISTPTDAISTIRTNKYLTDSAPPVDSGGALFLNPYVADPYPTSYWESNYTAGESTF